MDYAAKFNELSRFAPHKVSNKKRKMDHFEQGLRGNIKSMIGGQTFQNFQDMYKEQLKLLECWENQKMKIDP